MSIEELPSNLIKVINNGECVTTEFKKARRKLPDNLFDTVCGMLNRYGGHIFLGVSDDGHCQGVETGYVQNMRKDFANQCNNPQKIAPTVHLELKEYHHDDAHILYLYVYQSSDVHRTAGKVIDRNEDGDFDITNNTVAISQLYLQKQNTYTENKIYPYADILELRKDLIGQARSMALSRKPDHVWGGMTDIELLRSAGLYDKDRATGQEGINLAGILLFGTDDLIRSVIPYYKTDAILRVNDIERYDDRDDIRTNLLDAYNRLVGFVKKHTDDRFALDGSQRISARDIIAREVCVNMLIHREYSNPSPARLIIGRETLETSNASKARTVGYIDINSYTPYPKNPKIAAVFKEIGLADELGSGMKKIMNYSWSYSGRTPKFREDASLFNAQIYISPPRPSKELSSNLADAIYALISQHNGVSRNEINQFISSKFPELSPNQDLSKLIFNALTKLKRQGRITNVGSRTAPSWQIVKS
jgi:ATP-dependent DNA helicase RecG